MPVGQVFIRLRLLPDCRLFLFAPFGNHSLIHSIQYFLKLSKNPCAHAGVFSVSDGGTEWSRPGPEDAQPYLISPHAILGPELPAGCDL
jgi:hypothetical protein